MDKAKVLYGLRMTVAVGFLVLSVLSACLSFSDNVEKIKARTD